MIKFESSQEICEEGYPEDYEFGIPRSSKVRPSMDEILMETAVVMSRRGTCGRLQVGAVLSREGRILSTGYNGNVAGLDHCDHRDENPCATAVHAEENVLYFAAKHGVKTDEADLFVTHVPCFRCSRGLVNAGIARVVYRHPYRDLSGMSLLLDCGVVVEQMRA